MAKGDDRPVSTREAADYLGADVKAVREAATSGKVPRWGAKVKASSMLDVLAEKLGIEDCPLCGHALREPEPEAPPAETEA